MFHYGGSFFLKPIQQIDLFSNQFNHSCWYTQRRSTLTTTAQLCSETLFKALQLWSTEFLWQPEMSSCRAEGMPTVQRRWASLTVTMNLPQRCKMGPTCSCTNIQSVVVHMTSPFLQVRWNEIWPSLSYAQEFSNGQKPQVTQWVFMGQQGTESSCGRHR